jgi:hypothetical protein
MPYLPVPAVLFSAIVQTALIVSPCLWGARRGMRSGVLGLKPAILGAAALAVWTLLLQVEYSREHLAFEVWKNGGALGAGLAWEPRPLPFAVILWQFGVLAIATSRRRPILKEPV